MPSWISTLHGYLAFIATASAVVFVPAISLVLTLRRMEKKIDLFMLQHKLLWIEYCDAHDIPNQRGRQQCQPDAGRHPAPVMEQSPPACSPR